jgi:hypothetical protein
MMLQPSRLLLLLLLLMLLVRLRPLTNAAAVGSLPLRLLLGSDKHVSDTPPALISGTELLAAANCEGACCCCCAVLLLLLQSVLAQADAVAVAVVALAAVVLESLVL